MGNVKIIWMLLRHGPGDAEFVRETVPDAAVALTLDHAALEAGRAPGPDVAGIRAQPLQHGLRRLGQLLHEIHDDDLLIKAEAGEEFLVGEFVNAGLIATKVD